MRVCVPREPLTSDGAKRRLRSLPPVVPRPPWVTLQKRFGGGPSGTP